MTAARATWYTRVFARAAKRLVFLDETFFTTNMARRHGYAPRGQRLEQPAPHRHFKTTTFVGGLTRDGIIAPMIVDGPLTASLFTAYIEPTLVPESRPGDLLILDNLSVHKTAGVQAALRAGGIAYLYLPPYSPDFNPIENAFSKLKSLARKAALRTVETLEAGIGKWIDMIRPQESGNYLGHCGYHATIT